MARYYASTNNSNWGMFYDVSEGGYNINNNTSPVYVSVYLYRPNSASYYGGTADISFTLNGETKSTSAYPSYPTNIGAGEGNAHLMASFSYTVPHNSDGSKSVSFSLSWSANFSPTSASGSGSMTLATIPRASEISSMSNVYIGENTTINVNRKSGSFTHTITYSFGSLSGTIVTKSSSAGVSWTIPETFYGQMTDTTQKNVTLYITTYSGNSQVGDRKSSTFTLRTKESVCSPDINATIKDINEDTLALTGNELYFVNGYSTIEVAYEATAKKSASIASVKVNNDTVQTNPYELTASGINNAIKVTAYDSRGYSGTKEFVAGTDYRFIDYILPTANVTVKRAAPTSNEMLISFSGNYFNNSFGEENNTLTLSWNYREYKSYNPDNWTSGRTLVLGTDYVLNGNTYHSGDNVSYEDTISLGNSFDYRKNYEIQLIFEDKLTTHSITSMGLRGTPIVNWNSEFFKVNGDLKVTDDIIVELKAPYNYTSDDLVKIRNYVLGTETLTEDEIEKYDINKDGVVNPVDYIVIKKLIDNGIDTTHSAKLKMQKGMDISNLAFVWEDANDNEIAKIGLEGMFYKDVPVNNACSYSTNEIVVGRWINNKPLYRKVITTTETVTNDTTIAHHIDDVDLIYVKRAFINHLSSNVSWTLPIDLYGTTTTSTDRMGVTVSRSQIQFKCDTTWGTSWNKIIILEYTKTTD